VFRDYRGGGVEVLRGLEADDSTTYWTAYQQVYDEVRTASRRASAPTP